MTITTTAPVHTTNDAELLAALDASPEFVTVNNPGHLADLLGIQTPSTAALAILGDTFLASGIERGIIAAGILDRITPDDVMMEEANLGADRRTRSVSLYQDGPDGHEQITLSFLDRTPNVWVHIDGDDAEHIDELMTPAAMFDAVRAYYRS